MSSETGYLVHNVRCEWAASTTITFVAGPNGLVKVVTLVH